MKSNQLISILLILIFLGCSPKTFEASKFAFPIPIDTNDRAIEMQEKKTYSIEAEGIFADNQFEGARLNGFEKTGTDQYQAIISPENVPINESPFYAFKLWAKEEQNITLELHYTVHKHRYSPKISRNGNDWAQLDNSLFWQEGDSTHAFLKLEISPDTLWVAAQELLTSSKVAKWGKLIAQQADCKYEIFGKSKLGRDLFMLDIGVGDPKNKEVIAVLSRQHPPEVTGYLAMKAFIEEIMADTPLSIAFRKKYRVLVFPMMNPDGVDLGHWRHNAGGIDLNRDWAFYRQPETRQVANSIVKKSREQDAKVILGLDFHSTYYDVYYTNKMIPAQLAGFKDYWIQGIENSLPDDFEAVEKEAPVAGAPVSKGWFYEQFQAESIVYEIGDNTPRDFIKVKGSVSAIEMMQLLIFR